MLDLINYSCTVDTVSPKISCEDYVQVQEEQNLPCITDIVYKAKITNSGDECTILERIRLKLDLQMFTINAKNWEAEKKIFCPEEELAFRRVAQGIDLCSFAGKEIDANVRITDNLGEKLTARGGIIFPEPTILGANTSTVVVVPPISAPVSPSCSSKPDSITLKLSKKTCDESSNSQGVVQSSRKMSHTRRGGVSHKGRVVRSSRRRTNHNSRGKGSQKGVVTTASAGGSIGSIATTPTALSCQSCVDHDTANHIITSMSQSSYLIINAKDCTDGSRIELYKGISDFNSLITIPSPPDCLEIEIKEKNGSYETKIQTVSFDTTCSVGSPLNNGDTFGAVEIVSME